MTKHDRDNLNFLLSIDAITLHDWYTTASSDDIEYATELLDAFQSELDAKAVEISIEKQLIANEQYSEAKAVLSKFQLH